MLTCGYPDARAFKGAFGKNRSKTGHQRKIKSNSVRFNMQAVPSHFSSIRSLPSTGWGNSWNEIGWYLQGISLKETLPDIQYWFLFSKVVTFGGKAMLFPWIFRSGLLSCKRIITRHTCAYVNHAIWTRTIMVLCRLLFQPRNPTTMSGNAWSTRKLGIPGSLNA